MKERYESGKDPDATPAYNMSTLAVIFLLALLFPGSALAAEILCGPPSVIVADTLKVVGERPSGFLDWLKEWQTLVAGMLALIAAIGAARAAMRAARAAKEQLNFQHEESASRQRRRAQACRAVLPVDLAAFMDYLEKCYRVAVMARRALRSYEENRGPAKPTLEALEMPRIPDRIIANMQVLIEHLDEYNADIITKVLRVYQVQNARFEDALQFAKENCDSASAPFDMDETFKYTVFLFLLIENMWRFSRDEEEKIPPFIFSEEKACNALHVLEQILPVNDRIDHDERGIFDYVAAASKYYRCGCGHPAHH